MNPVIARIGGLAAAILLVAVGYMGIAYTLRPPSGSYEVTAVLGRAGQGLGGGTDVKARGVIVGEVTDVRLEDGHAVATLTLLPDARLPDPSRMQAVVSSKTFLGEKQLELLIDGEIDEPFLSAGDTLGTPEGTEVREPVDLFEAFGDFIEAIPAPELGQVIQAFGTFTQEDAEIAGRNLDLSDELFAFQARTADEQIDRFSDLADIIEAVEPRTGDLNRLMRTLPRWTTVLPDRQLAFRQQMEALSSFSLGLAEFLEVNESDLSRLNRLGQQVLLTIEPRVGEIGNIIHGAYRYAYNFGKHGSSLSDGSEAGWQKVLFPLFEEMCHQFPEDAQEQLLAEFIPHCPVPPGGPGHTRDESGPYENRGDTDPAPSEDSR